MQPAVHLLGQPVCYHKNHKGGVHDFRGCQIFSLFCRLILQTSVRGDILFRIVATRKNSICFRQQEGFRLRIE